MEWILLGAAILFLFVMTYRSFRGFAQEGKAFLSPQSSEAELIRIENIQNNYGRLRRAIFVIAGEEFPLIVPEDTPLPFELPATGTLTRLNGAFVRFIPHSH